MRTTPPLPSRPRHRASLALLLALTVLLATPSCGTSSPEASPESTGTASDVTTATSSSTSGTALPGPAAEVVDAYQRFWNVYLAASDPPNPNDPELARVASGVGLDTARESLRQKLVDGTLTRKPTDSKYRHVAEVTTLDQTSAIVSNCAVDDLLVVRVIDGEIVNSNVDTLMLTGYLHKSDDGWKVSDIQEVRRLSGEQQCSWS